MRLPYESSAMRQFESHRFGGNCRGANRCGATTRHLEFAFGWRMRSFVRHQFVGNAITSLATPKAAHLPTNSTAPMRFHRTFSPSCIERRARHNDGLAPVRADFKIDV